MLDESSGRSSCRAAGRATGDAGRRAAARRTRDPVGRLGARARISLRKKAGAATVAAGATVTYRLIVSVTGGIAHGVVVCDRLPAHMTYVSLGSATLRSGEACWDVGDLSGPRALALTTRVDVGTGTGKLVNQATATSSNAGPAKARASIRVPASHGVKGVVRGQVVKSAGVTG